MWPFLYQAKDFAIPTYLVINSLAFCIGVAWAWYRAESKSLERTQVLDVGLALMLGGFIGARLFHIIFEHPRFYYEHPQMILMFWYGGFVFYGGMIGSWVATSLYCRVKKLPFLKIADLYAPVLALGYALGRVGCLAAGCCFGSLTTLPWGITFPQGVEAPSGVALHPTQIYSSVFELGVLGVLLVFERRKKFAKDGQIFGFWLALHGLGRGLIEQFRGDFRGPSPLNLSISTWLSGLVIIVGVYLISTAEE